MHDDLQAGEVKTPFEPQPSDLSGCGKPAVIGCLALLVIVAIGLVVFVVKARNMLDWALVKYEEVVVENLAPEVTQPERERLQSAFESARNAIRQNRMDPSALQSLQRFMSSPPRADQKIGSDAVRELTEALEAVARARVELPSPKPAGASASGLTAVVVDAGV